MKDIGGMTGSKEIYKDENPFVPFPHDKPVEWFALSKPFGIRRERRAAVIEFSLAGKRYNLNLSFPDCGGIRLYSNDTGFHEAKSYKELNYETENDGIKISAYGETEVKIATSQGGFMIELFHRGRRVNAIKSGDISLGFDDDGNIAKVKLCGDIRRGESFTGLGERFDHVVRNGTRSLLWNIDCGFQAQNERSDERIYSYTNIPLLHSSEDYTLFLNTSYAVYADIGKEDACKYSFDCFGPTLDLYFWTGEFHKRLDAYLSLTGRNILPPKWAFSYWAGNSAIYFTHANGGDHHKTLDIMMRGYSHLGTPIKTMFVEGVIHKDPKVYEYLKKTNTRVFAWHDSAYALKNKPENIMIEDSPHLRPLFPKSEGELPQKYCDFTHPNALAVMDALHGKYINLGISGAMIDFADAVPYNSISHCGKTGDEMHNLYAYFYQKTFKELYEKYNGNDFLLFARAGFSGTQSFMAKFLGDEPCTFHGMKISLIAGLNLSISGFSLWGCDIGGLGVWRKHIPTEDCYRRWMQWAAFNPIMRSHGHTTRAPWDFSADAARDFQKYYWLRENLIDTIYSHAVNAGKTADIMAEPMALAFPNDETVSSSEDEYMFCSDILVAPVLEERALAREVTLPRGEWIDFWTGSKIKGGKFKARASEGTIPLFLRLGTLLKISLPESLNLGENMQNGRFSALLITPANNRREAVFYKNETEAESFSSFREGGKTVIINKNGADIKAVVAKGIAAASIYTDGVALEKRDDINAQSDAGFTVDHIKNQTTVRLPKRWERLEIEESRKTIKNLALNKMIYSETDSSSSFHRTIADGWAFNYWTVPRSGASFTLDLEEIKDISEIQLTWGIDYADSYTIETSIDGQNRKISARVENGTGDEETIKLPPGTTARYIRFSDFSFPQRTPAVLGDIRVYGTEFEE